MFPASPIPLAFVEIMQRQPAVAVLEVGLSERQLARVDQPLGSRQLGFRFPLGLDRRGGPVIRPFRVVVGALSLLLRQCLRRGLGRGAIPGLRLGIACGSRLAVGTLLLVLRIQSRCIRLRTGIPFVLRGLGLVQPQPIEVPGRQQRRDCGENQHRRQHSAERRDAGVVSRPSHIAFHLRLAAGLNRLVVQEPLEVRSQVFGRTVPPRRFARDRLVNDRDQIARHLLPNLVERLRLPGRDLLDEPVAFLLVERRAHRQQFVQREAERIHVAPRVASAFKRFGRHVAKRAEHVAGVRECVRAAAGHLRQAEVGDPHGPAHVQQQIAGFDVAMQNALFVGVFQGLGHLQADVRHALPVRLLLRGGLASGTRPRQSDGRRRNGERIRKPARSGRFAFGFTARGVVGGDGELRYSAGIERLGGLDGLVELAGH